MVAKFKNKRSGEVFSVDIIKKVDEHTANFEGKIKNYWRAVQPNGNERFFDKTYWENLNEIS